MRPISAQLAPIFVLALALCGPRLTHAAEPEVVPPKLDRFVEADLPEGTPLSDVDVVLWITVGTDGTARDVEVKESAGEPWDAAAVEAARQFAFAPATSAGEPVLVRVPFTYSFRKPQRRGRIVPAPRPRRGIEPAPGLWYAGRLAEKGTRKAVAGLPVRLVDPRTDNTWEALTDGEGVFVFYGLPPGSLRLNIESGEFRTVRKTIKGSRGDPPEKPEPEEPFYLAPSAAARYRTVIRDRRPPAAATEIALTEDEILKVPGTFGDPTRVVATLPGVARTPFGLGYYVVRGASFENTGFFVDRHPVLLLYHLLGGPSVIHPELVGELKFYPGGYPASYGRVATGIIALDTKDPPTDRWHLDIEIDLLKATALFSVPFDDQKGEVTLSFRRSYYDLLLPLFTDSLDLAYTDYQARVKYAFSPTFRARLAFLGAWDEVSFSGQAGQSTQEQSTGFGVGFHRALAAAEWDLSKELTWSTSVIGEYDFNEAARTSEDEDDIDADVIQLFTQALTYLQWRPATNFSAEGGLDFIYGGSTAKLSVPSFPPLGDPRPPEFDPIIIDYDVDGALVSIAPYLLADWEVVDGVRLLPGLRIAYDDFGEATSLTADPRLGIRWRLNDMWTLKAMGGIAHQLPAGFQVVEPFGDPTLPWTRGSQVSAGFEWRWNDDWEVSVEGFYNHLHNMVRPNQDFDVEEGEGLERDLWQADMQGRAYGLELLIRKHMTDWLYGWLSYTLSRAERLRPPEDWTLYELDQSHILNLAWTVDLGAEWSVGARFQLATGNYYFPITGSRYDADRDRYQPIYSPNQSRLEPYHRLDIRIDKRFRYDTWMLEVYLDIQNVYNQANSESPLYSYDFSIRTEGAYIPILPTLGVRAVF